MVAAAAGGAGTAWAAKSKKSANSPTVPAPGKTYAWSFQADTLGHLPAHTLVLGGTWTVAEDSALAPGDPPPPPASAAQDVPPARPRLLTQSETDDGIAYHYLTFTRPFLEDLDASVRFRIRSGEIDPSAGLLFQMDQKGTSGYLVRVSAKTGELAFHYMLYGKRRDVKYVKVDPPAPGSWHTIAIQRRGMVLHALYDGKEVMRVRDDRYSKGNVGVWAEDDTLVDFAELTATAR
jgi:hypothetical protein